MNQLNQLWAEAQDLRAKYWARRARHYLQFYMVAYESFGTII